MAKDCIDILKNKMLELSNEEEKQELQEIFSREIEIPQSKCFDIENDTTKYEEDLNDSFNCGPIDSFLIDDYLTDEARIKLGL